MLLPFLDLKFEKYKISSCLVRILIDLAVDHQREDTRHLNFPHTDLNLWWVHKKVDLWYCHISILMKINHSFITWIIYVISFIRHLCVTLYKWMWKTCFGKSAAKNTEIIKHPMFWFWICHFVYLITKKNSF